MVLGFGFGDDRRLLFFGYKNVFFEELKEIFQIKSIHKSTQYYFQTCFDMDTVAGPLNFFGVKKACESLSTFDQLFGITQFYKANYWGCCVLFIYCRGGKKEVCSGRNQNKTPNNTRYSP